jgi:hypothetical protein
VLLFAEVFMMNERNSEAGRDAAMDSNAVYQEEVFTDRKVGVIRRLTPMTTEGMRDLERKVLYVGQAEIMTNMGPVPINFEIEADTFAQAIAGFGAAAEAGIERTAQQIQEMRRQQASQLVVPGMGALGGPPPAPGRGKIQFP